MPKNNKSKGFLNYFLYLFIVILIFAFIDFLVHYNFDYFEIFYYPIPSSLSFISTIPLVWYSFGKFFGSLIIGSLLYPLVIKIKNYWLAIAVFSFVITILLEVRYIMSGYYSNEWHFYNFLQHTITLYLVAYFIFLKSKIFASN